MSKSKKTRGGLLSQPSVTRITLGRELRRQYERLGRRGAGIVLDVGSKNAPYRELIAADQYMTLDIDQSCQPDICCDLHDIQWESEFFDTIIATEVLEHLHDPQLAINEMFRVLKPGGVCILSTRFVYQYHADPNDYYRFTPDSLGLLCSKFDEVAIIPHGNRILAVWQLLESSKKTLGLLSWLNPLVARLNQRETDCPLGFVVWAKR